MKPERPKPRPGDPIYSALYAGAMVLLLFFLLYVLANPSPPGANP